MNKLISFCGINCETCEARIATINNDDKLREETAEKWRKSFSPEITAAHINCTGCRTEGVKIAHHASCQIRLCAIGRGYGHCGACADLESCELAKYVLDHCEDARANLKSLL